MRQKIAFIALLTLVFFGCPQLHAEKRRELLIIGCARSGTFYITEVLKACGLRIGHEWIRSDGVCSWEMTVDSEEVPWGDAKEGCRFDHVFHQVRHPLKVISSLYHTEPRRSFPFIRKYLNEIHDEDSRLTVCAKYWYYWNLLAEQQAEFTYKIEDLKYVWKELERRLGRQLDKSVLKSIPQTTNTRGAVEYFTWEELERELDPDLYGKIRVLAQRYGY